MPAHKGNTTAEKWTVETVLPLLEKIESYAKKPSCMYIGSALVKVDLYKDIWRHWKNKFSDNDDVLRTIKRIEQIFENKLFEKALTGKVNATVAIFGLKNNHKWRDKHEIDHTTAGESLKADKTDYSNLEAEELKQLIYLKAKASIQ